MLKAWNVNPISAPGIRPPGMTNGSHHPAPHRGIAMLFLFTCAYGPAACFLSGSAPLRRSVFENQVYSMMMTRCATGGRTIRSRFFWALFLGLFLACPGQPAWAAAPSITKITLLPTRQLEFQLALDVGESYTFEVSTNLADWMAVGGIDEAPASSLTVVDENTVDLAPALFFRLKVGRYTRFSFGLAHYVQAGQFSGAATTPTVSLPATFSGYRAWFEAEGDSPYPEVSTVLFTGPAGSGLSATPAALDDSSADEGWYMSPTVSSTFGAPTGTWTVNYRGTNMTFTSDLDMLSQLVLPVPTVVLANGLVQSVSWVYRDRVSGAALSAPPSYMQQIMVQLEGSSGRLYDSPDGGAPSVTTHTLTEPVTWSEVTGLNMAYDDLQDNHYVIFYRRQ